MIRDIPAGTSEFESGTAIWHGTTFLGGRIALYDAVGQGQPTAFTLAGDAFLDIDAPAASIEAGQPAQGAAFGPDLVRLEGVVAVTAPGASLSLSGGDFTNAGRIAVGTGNALTVAAAAFVNTGAITIAGSGARLEAGPPSGRTPSGMFGNAGRLTVCAGALLDIGAGAPGSGYSWQNTGTVRVESATLRLDTAGGLPSLQRIAAFGASTLELAGLLDLAGSRLSAHLDGFRQIVLSGELRDGTVIDPNGGIRFATDTQDGLAIPPVLDGIRWSGTLDLGAPDARLAIAGGLAMRGAAGGLGTLRLTGADSELEADRGTLAGTRLLLGGMLAQTDGAATLTLAREDAVTIVGTQARIEGNVLLLGRLSGSAGSALMLAGNFHNGGTIVLKGGSLEADPALENGPGASLEGHGTVAGTLLNDGVLVASGGTLALAGDLGGTGVARIDLGATLSITATVTAGQTIGFGAHAMLDLSYAADCAGVLAALRPGDAIDLAHDKVVAAERLPHAIELTLADGSTQSLQTAGGAFTSVLSTPDGHGGSLLTFGA